MSPGRLPRSDDGRARCIAQIGLGPAAGHASGLLAARLAASFPQAHIERAPLLALRFAGWTVADGPGYEADYEDWRATLEPRAHGVELSVDAETPETAARIVSELARVLEAGR